MDDSPDYQSYSLEELYDVAQHIDREKYPQRYAVVAQEILKQEKQRTENPPVLVDREETKVGWARCCAGTFAGATCGIVAAILLLSLFPPADNPSADGMNRWGGHMGLVMMGTLFGGICGILVAAGKQAAKMIAIATAILVATMMFFIFLRG